jgi:superfamily II DNA helicase RecQ
VFIVGYIFNRKSRGCIEIFPNELSDECWDAFQQRDRTTCCLLVDEGILVTKQHEKAFRAVGTYFELYRWATTDAGCRVVALSNRFGILGVSNCNVCDPCRGTPVAKTAAVARTKADAAVTNENKALLVLKRLETMCLVCRKSSCDGETCLGKSKCYKCGGEHFAYKCKGRF